MTTIETANGLKEALEPTTTRGEAEDVFKRTSYPLLVRYCGVLTSCKEFTELTMRDDFLLGIARGVKESLNRAEAAKQNGPSVKVTERCNSEGEWCCRLHVNGKHVKEADYYTDDANDAHWTAKEMVKHARANYPVDY